MDRQLKLVVLDKKFFPSEIVKKFESEKEEQMKKEKIHPQECTMQKILEGTKYFTVDKKISKRSEASIFRDIDKVTKSLF